MNSQIFLFNFKFIINIIIFDDLATLIANKKIIVFNHLLYYMYELDIKNHEDRETFLNGEYDFLIEFF